MSLPQVRLNPVNSTYHVDVSSDVASRRERVRDVMRAQGLRALIIEKSLDGNELWLNDIMAMAAPTPGLYIVGLEGPVRFVDGCRVVEEGPAVRTEHWMLPSEAVEMVSGFSADDLRVMIGDTGRLGVTYPDRLPALLHDYLEERLPGVALVDMTDALQMEKAVKSAAEMDILRYVAAGHDKLFQAIPAMLNDGCYERDLVQRIRHAAYGLGSGGFGVIYTAMTDLYAFRPGVRKMQPRYPGRAIGRGDLVQIKVQAHLLNGYYGVLGCVFSLGEPDEESCRRYHLSVEAADAVAAALTPGATLKEAAAQDARVVEARGYQVAEPLMAYGVGATYAEPPLLGDATEDAPLRENMVIAVGVPVAAEAGDPALCCWDAYVVKPGGAERLGWLSRDIVTV